MEQILQRLSVWIRKNTPEIADSLNIGANREALEDLENYIGRSIPDQIKKLYVWHNGQKPMSTGLFYGFQFVDIESARFELSEQRLLAEDSSLVGIKISQPENVISTLFVNPYHIPLARDWGGNFIAYDLDPDIKGKVGQIIAIGADQQYLFLIAESLEGFLEWYVRHLESGNYRYVKKVEGRMSLEVLRPEVEHFFDALPKMLTQS